MINGYNYTRCIFIKRSISTYYALLIYFMVLLSSLVSLSLD